MYILDKFLHNLLKLLYRRLSNFKCLFSSIFDRKNNTENLVRDLTNKGIFKDVRIIVPATGISEIERIRLHKLLKNQIPLKVDFEKKRSLFPSETSLLRAKHFIKAVRSDKLILWALRGGYGAAQLLKHLCAIKKPDKEKIIIGYSDITALHVFLSQKWGWKSIHGAMITELLNDSKDPNNFLKIYDVLNNKPSIIKMCTLNKVSFGNKLLGKIIGGNMAIMRDTIGTRWQIETAGKILFLEDARDLGYKIDRILNHFEDADLFKKVKAVIFGKFHNPVDEYVGYALDLFAKRAEFPVFKTNFIGHGRHNFPIVINSQAQIKKSQNNKFSLITRLHD